MASAAVAEKKAKAAATVAAVAVALGPIPVKPAKLVAIGPTTDKMFALREEKRKFTAAIEKLDEEYNALEEALFLKLDAEGTTKGAGKNAMCSITEAVVPNITDWDAFYAFIAKKKFFHLLQRRPSDAAVRELYEKGMTVPGTEPYKKRRMNLRVSAS